MNSQLLRRFRSQPLVLAGASVLLIFVVVAVFAPLLAGRDPAQLNLVQRLQPPSMQHWFGTDELGRDVFARTLFGARVSLAVAVAVVTLSLGLGLVLGTLAGFYGGWLDTAINLYLTNAFLALPGILLAVAFVAFLGPSLPNLILALALSGWVNYARLVRAQVMAVKEREFIAAARALGSRDSRLVLRHILPNIVQPLIVQAAVGMAAAVLAEATLSFLGLGIQPPTPTWGAMLNDARSHLFESPYLIVFPALAVALLVLAFNLVGDGLRDLLDPRSNTPDAPRHSVPKLERRIPHMKIGVISDTHSLLRPEVFTALDGVDHILHAGDIGDITILERLRSIAPVTAIRGNIDVSGPCASLPETEAVGLNDVLLYMLHSASDLDLHPHAAGIGVVISGHSHKPSITWKDGVLYLNPGSAGPRRFRLPVTVALLRLDGSVPSAEILDLAL